MVRRKLQEAADPPENVKNGVKGKKKNVLLKYKTNSIIMDD